MTTKLYGDLFSQPCRAISMFVRANKLDVEEVPVLLLKGETKQEAFRSKFPLGNIPALEVIDGSTAHRLTESCAILTYLAAAKAPQVADHWYPKDLKARSVVDSAMHWHHSAIRSNCMAFLLHAGALPVSQGVNVAQRDQALDKLRVSLGQLENVWLSGSGGFIGGCSQPNIADLLISCELEMLVMMNKEKHGIHLVELLQPFPKVHKWMTTVAQALAPHYEAVHEPLYAMVVPSGGCSSPNFKKKYGTEVLAAK